MEKESWFIVRFVVIPSSITVEKLVRFLYFKMSIQFGKVLPKICPTVTLQAINRYSIENANKLWTLSFTYAIVGDRGVVDLVEMASLLAYHCRSSYIIILNLKLLK